MYDIKKIEISDNENYPKKLLKIKNPPQKLYAIGNYKLLNSKSIAIVGSRKATEYGKKVAKIMANNLSKNGVCIISGLAVGIDTEAHLYSKGEIGKTIAVLGSGLNNIFPKENEELFKDIINYGGCIISEFEPNEKVKSENFPIRNRIVSGLSDGVLVIEAREKCGSTITARLAIEQNKKLYCIPGNIDNKYSVGTNKLIQNGAKLVLNSNDILCDLGIKINEDFENNIDNKVVKVKRKEVDDEYKEIYNLINEKPINANYISKKINKNIGMINEILTMLELQGVIKQVGISEYIIN